MFAWAATVRPRTDFLGMRDLSKLPNDLDRETGTCRAIIETPKGRRGKFSFDPETGLFLLKKLLPEGMSFPLDYGFVPSTLCEDGDPLDIMVLTDEPSPVGALVEVRLIGVLEAEEHEKGKVERNDRLLAIPLVSRLYSRIHAASELDADYVKNLAQFWVDKAKLEGKSFKLLAVKDAPAAIALVHRGTKQLKKAS
jgi:inorganic pyrophosphatase